MIWPIRTGTTPRNPTHEEIAIREFTNTDLTPELSRQQAAIFLDDKKLLQNIRGLAPEDQERFVERVDQVRRDGSFSLSPIETLPIVSAKAYPTIDPRNVKFINVLGDVCRAHMQLPTSAILSAGLDKRGDVAITSGGLTDIWPGEYRGAQVTIKVFRIHPSQKREKAKEVRTWSGSRASLQTKFTDPVETSAHLEEVVPRKHLAISWCGHDTLPARPCLRLGGKR